MEIAVYIYFWVFYSEPLFVMCALHLCIAVVVTLALWNNLRSSIITHLAMFIMLNITLTTFSLFVTFLYSVCSEV